MITTFNEVETYLSQLIVKPTSPSERLEFVKHVLELFGNPQNKVPAIHIAGTSGKGSTAYYAAAMLQEAGYRVGLAVSPHVNSVAERSQINGAILPEDEYCHHFSTFIALVERHEVSLSYIEFLTIFTFWLFAQQKLDYMVIEVGLGGRLDSTNTITRPLTVRLLTDIGLDHTEVLGGTLAAIASEKAGIIHSSDTVLTHRQPTEVLEVFERIAAQKEAALSVLSNDIAPSSSAPKFQQRNVTLAYAGVQAALELTGKSVLDTSAIDSALSIQIPGRFEQLRYEGVDIILDVAHNAQKMGALVEAIHSQLPGRNIECLVAFGSGKESSVQASLVLLRQCCERITITNFTAPTFGTRGAVSHATMRENAKNAGFEETNVLSNTDPYAAFSHVLATARAHNSTVLVTGSFYLIDGIRELILGMQYN